MTVFYEVKCLAVVSKGFTTNEGEQVDYKECYFLDEKEDGTRTVIQINSKLPEVEKFEGKECVIGVDMDISGSKKPKLTSIKEAK